MGCVISAVPPAHSKNKGGWCPCFICVDQSYTVRHSILFNKLSGITDLALIMPAIVLGGNFPDTDNVWNSLPVVDGKVDALELSEKLRIACGRT